MSKSETIHKECLGHPTSVSAAASGFDSCIDETSQVKFTIAHGKFLGFSAPRMSVRSCTGLEDIGQPTATDTADICKGRHS